MKLNYLGNWFICGLTFIFIILKSISETSDPDKTFMNSVPWWFVCLPAVFALFAMIFCEYCCDKD